LIATMATDADFYLVLGDQAEKAPNDHYDGKRHLEGCYFLDESPENVRPATAHEMTHFRYCIPCMKRVGFTPNPAVSYYTP
jgi:hypothetical protein